MARELVWPSRLPDPPAVTVFSPSSSPAPFPRRRERAFRNLCSAFADVRTGPGWLRDDRNRAGTAAERARELDESVANGQSRLLMASTGGYSCNEILPLLDYERVRAARPAICGFSDVSTLLLALLAQAGIVCFHGPSALPSYGEPGGADAWSHRCLLDVVCKRDRTMTWTAPGAYTGAPDLWDRTDGERRARVPAPAWSTVRPGVGRGRLICANLEALSA